MQSIEEAKLACELGASALGLVSAMPSGPGPISEELIAEIAAWAPPGVATFLLTSHTTADSIIKQHERCRTQVIQLVDALPREEFKKLRAGLPGVKLVQVIHVRDAASINEAAQAMEIADALLLDSGNPTAEVKELGGTGRVHDWQLSAEIVRESSKPVYLAGGLTPENVAEAIAMVQPFGVDVCSGVRTEGKLDRSKLERFMSTICNIST
jgi:phosphoribosylanthranilate isomerase